MVEAEGGAQLRGWGGVQEAGRPISMRIMPVARAVSSRRATRTG